ncbi:MAG: formate dehydrogenase accessory sulfurtransferase FdhD [Thermodesulfobacteriota bacterium]
MEASYPMPVIRIADGGEEELLDPVAAEIAFTLRVNGQVLVSLLCSPIELDAMAVGFLLSEGILSRRGDLLAVEVDEQTFTVSVTLADLPADWQDRFHRRTITSGCGHGVTFTDAAALADLGRRPPLRLRTCLLFDLLRDFRRRSTLFLETGGVHSAALADRERLLLFSEDIGRHNAVDKLLGKAFLAGIDLTDKLLLSSGRISGEIMTKVIRNRIPVLVSRAAPTCMSITRAEDHGVTLIGFARNNRMNIYSRPLGVVFEDLVAGREGVHG